MQVSANGITKDTVGLEQNVLSLIVITFITIRLNIPIFVVNMNNTRFATVVHILTLLAKSPGEWLSSDWIAGSIQVNPVIVRKELSTLQKQGWVVSRKGKEGGSMLLVSSKEITLADIYKTVKNSEVLGKLNLNPNPKCPVGKDINKELEGLFAETYEIVFGALQHRTLEGFVKKFI
jgi:DNA-binding IscR family transcriptional regulator